MIFYSLPHVEQMWNVVFVPQIQREGAELLDQLSFIQKEKKNKMGGILHFCSLFCDSFLLVFTKKILIMIYLEKNQFSF